MSGEKVVVLCPSESVPPDDMPFRPIEADAESRPPSWADDAVEDIIVNLSSLEAAWIAGEFSRLSKLADTLVELANLLGAATLAQIATDAAELSRSNDDVALAAVMARLVRVGESSLVTLIETGYQKI